MKTFLLIAEHRRGELRPISLEVIAAAQELRQADDKVVVAVIGEQAENYVADLSVAGVDEIITVKTATVEFDPDIFEAAITSLMEKLDPEVVLLPHSVDSLGYAATLARKGNYGFATDVYGLQYDGDELVATRSGYDQKVNVELDFPGKQCVLLTIRPSVFKPTEEKASPSVSSEDMTNIESRSTNLEFVEAGGADDIDITTVDFIMSIGRGIAEEANVEQFRELAEMADATLCCSRPIADSGWLPKSRQVGQSGKVVGSCKLYVAMGISGSIQHMAGMKHVPTIVAVNSDPGASIFTIAKYGIVGDIFEIEEELRSHFE
ncbi:MULTISPECIES: electron transfer flavoprotein subunit alpha/FixB family protein [unclassified Methylophaga]|jgi:electron transfer flavoprotein alpha subunit|uniref:electron transfer flavoprotein subunit alpha/FixB family protein n=2 Tax=Methylophaga TaxID=40222 RepID=UPI000C8B786A|nr:MULTISPECIES: electron transfer flavoprotein subunit alpha/FixB family protein [unclassified Methylophaga]MAL48843.1 electron transfer flavoprotein subunit alpha [Methylophaga sp.]MAP27378.1 electron transfer flavoprotein subunit alpha [Methylophaga sp.]HBX59036.1 electron transfer flavoprotein subunit alpha/FixB family protein [Methylophaga sp.]HCC79845.1 electron transfer flavoprotein subunit alpha/FixB family protein [Methylophaga sp.]HCO00932.1 electron transfer flavoprotein subunit alp|tara:strand:+ start:17210 stop:18169 length:960 start_codon:yes stop_codon:yes gene_type:complete